MSEARALSSRTVNFALATACALMLGYAWYAQVRQGLLPCPLCIFQRVGIALLGLAFLGAALHGPGGARRGGLWATVIGLIALLPAGVAARHVYIQSQPEGSVPACGATLDYMLDVFPLTTVVRKVLTGGGECASLDWSFLGLSMPAWVLVCSLALAALGILNNLRTARAAVAFRSRALPAVQD